MTDATLRQALAYVRHGWPVFPCLPGQKIPATQHGYLDATTDEQQITEWFGRGFTWNLAIATGAPGPDVLDVDQHGPAGNGYPAFATLERAGLVDGAAAYVRTPVFRAVERGHGDGVGVAGCVVRGLSGGLVLRGLVDGVTVAV